MIVDCVTYFNEADILRLRLEELDPVVDLFVIVEGDHTHAGQPKPSYLPRDIVARWGYKLHVHTAALWPGEGLTQTWRREIAQRNAIGDALAALRCADDDMILISDCDEIPRRVFVQLLWRLPDSAIAIAEQRLHYYTFNHISDARWLGTRATQYGNVRALGADGVRYAGAERGGYPARALVRDAGWHFSYFGGVAAVKTKIESFLHQEFNCPEHTDPETIAERIAAGRDIYDRSGHTFQIAANDDLPETVLANPDRWRAHFHPAYAPVAVTVEMTVEQEASEAYGDCDDD